MARRGSPLLKPISEHNYCQNISTAENIKANIVFHVSILLHFSLCFGKYDINFCWGKEHKKGKAESLTSIEIEPIALKLA